MDTHTRKKKVFYKISADATLHFKNGDTLRVNKGVLALQSNVFTKLFFASPQENNTDFDVDDFDSETFQTFLDCLIGLKPYSDIDSLLIYPIAHKFQVEKCLKKCVQVLKPTEMNDIVLLTFNLALFYECNELVKNIIDFLKDEVNVNKVLEDENLNQLLEPAAILKLMQNVVMDSYLWTKIYEWGENYLRKHGKDISVRRFFDENKILARFSLSHFESAQSILDFHKIVTKNNFLSSDEILIYLEKNLMKPEGKLKKNSTWMFVKKGEIIEEIITFKRPFSFAKQEHCIIFTKLKFLRNDILCYADRKTSNDYNFKTVRYELKFRFRDRHPDSENYTDDFDEKNYGTWEEKVLYNGESEYIKVHVDEPKHILQIKSIVCTYTFLCDCRILKAPLNEKLCVTDNNNLYFTNYIDHWP